MNQLYMIFFSFFSCIITTGRHFASRARLIIGESSGRRRDDVVCRALRIDFEISTMDLTKLYSVSHFLVIFNGLLPN